MNQGLELYQNGRGELLALDPTTGKLHAVIITEELPPALPTSYECEQEAFPYEASWHEQRTTQALVIPSYYPDEETSPTSSKKLLLPLLLIGLVALLFSGSLAAGSLAPPQKKAVAKVTTWKSSRPPKIVSSQSQAQQAKILAMHIGIPQERWAYVVMAWSDALYYGISPEIFVRQINQESGFQVRITSSAQAIGIAQIIPATARSWGVDPTDPVASLRVSADHMAWYVRTYGGSYTKALTCYNGGCGWITTCTINGVFVLSCLPRETRNYIYVILGV